MLHTDSSKNISTEIVPAKFRINRELRKTQTSNSEKIHAIKKKIIVLVMSFTEALPPDIAEILY